MSMRARASLTASVSAVVAGLVAGQAVAADDKPNLTGVWLVQKPQAELKTGRRQGAASNPKRRSSTPERKAARASGKNPDEAHTDPAAICLPHGVPRLLNVAQPILILQKPKQVTVLYQANHQSRLFYIDDPIPTADNLPTRTTTAFPPRKWDGKALVVNTYLTERAHLDGRLGPASRREAHGRGALRADRAGYAEHESDAHRPETFTAPWNTQVTYKRQPDLRFKEDVCAEKLWHPPSGSPKLGG